MRSGATHAVVHGPYYRDDEGDAIGAMARRHKARRQVAEFDGDKVYCVAIECR